MLQDDNPPARSSEPPIASRLDSDPDARARAPQTLTAGRLWRGIFLFLGLTALGFWILSRRHTFGKETLDALATVHPAAVVIATLQGFLDQVLGGFRIWFGARAIGERTGVWPSILANCANVFLGGVTPSQHGGGPGQIWILMRYGMRFSGAVITSLCTYMGTVLFFFILAGVLANASQAMQTTGALRHFTLGTLLLFAGTVIVVSVALPRPQWIIGLVRAVLEKIPRVGPRLAHSAAIAGFERLLQDYSVFGRRALRSGKLCMLAVALLSIGVYLNKFLIGYVLVRGLRIDAPLSQILDLQAMQALLTYFAPTPGASGFAEVTAAELMARVVPEGSLGAFIVLWRATSLYVGMLLGGITVIATGFATLRGPRAKRSAAASPTPTVLP